MFDFLSEKFSGIFQKITGKGSLTENNINEALQKVNDSLLEADVPYSLIQEFIEGIKNDVLGQKVTKSLNPGQQFIKIIHARLLTLLGGQNKTANFSFQIPSITMVLGLQGAGKTTTLAKLAHFVQKQAKKRGKKRNILLASVDFYRPAAIDQLEILAGQVGVTFYRASSNDPVQAAQEIVAYAKAHGIEMVFVDTAGRLHVDDSMLQELKDVETVLKPKYKFLVLDAMTGQESLNVALAFEKAVQFNAAILTKMDSDSRAGAAFSFRYILKKPIAFVGVGEKIDDLDQFYPERMADRILGMGDILSLIEKAEEQIEKKEQDKVYNSFKSGKLTLQDFADQMGMVGKFGSLSKLMKYIPGMSGLNISQEMLDQGESEMKKFKAIISSMTAKEKLFPKILDASRKKRIAKGAGVTVTQVNSLLQRFEQSQQYVKLFKRFGRF